METASIRTERSIAEQYNSLRSRANSTSGGEFSLLLPKGMEVDGILRVAEALNITTYNIVLSELNGNFGGARRWLRCLLLFF
jgi:hypothetical protein